MAALTVEPRGLRLCLGETAQLMLQNCGSGRLAFKILTTGTAACSVRPNEGFLEARSNAHVRVTLREQPPGLRLQVRAVASCAADAAVAAAFDRAADVAKLVVAVDYAAHDTAAADEPTDALLELLVRNVTRGSAPLGPVELAELRAARDRAGTDKWQNWLGLARDVKRRREAEAADAAVLVSFLAPPADAFADAFADAAASAARAEAAQLELVQLELEAARLEGEAARRAHAAASAAAAQGQARAAATLEEMRAQLDTRARDVDALRSDVDALRGERDSLLQSAEAAGADPRAVDRCARRLDAARGAALLAAALAADVRAADDGIIDSNFRSALDVAEEQLRSFAVHATELSRELRHVPAHRARMNRRDDAPVSPGASRSMADDDGDFEFDGRGGEERCGGPIVDVDVISQHFRARASPSGSASSSRQDGHGLHGSLRRHAPEQLTSSGRHWR